MQRRYRAIRGHVRDIGLDDYLGGAWIAALLLGLMQLPSLVS